MYEPASSGLMLHLRYMHYNLDPSSSDYLQPHQVENDQDVEIREQYQIGSQRVPVGRQARHHFLWEPLRHAFNHHFLVEIKMAQSVADEIVRVEDMMLAAGEILHPILVSHSMASLEDDDYNGDIFSFPI